MKVYSLLRPFVMLVAIGGAVLAAVATRAHWLHYLFPPRQEMTQHPEHEDDHPTDRIVLSQQAQHNLGLESSKLTPREYWRTILIPGAVAERPGESDRVITSRVTGVVSAIAATPGDTVKPGGLLFKLDLVSEFLQGTQIELAKAASDLVLANSERDRIAKLVTLGTTPAAELMKVQNQVERLTNLVRSLRRQLQLFGFSPDQVNGVEAGEVVTEVSILVPLRSDEPSADPLYEVRDLRVRIGDHVQAGATLCTLADHRKLFIEGWAFKTEARVLTLLAESKERIRVEFLDEESGDWPSIEPLMIHHLASQVDPANRTFPFYLSLDNHLRTFSRDGKTFFAWRFRPGQRVRLRIPIEKLVTHEHVGGTEVNPFVLKAGAVVREGPEAFVFVQAGDLFIRKPVRVLYEDHTDVVIANDRSVTRAENVVVNQAAAINRAIKAAAGGGEGHHHDH
jgi:membrane fusion protein, heavy metal efflux system